MLNEKQQALWKLCTLQGNILFRKKNSKHFEDMSVSLWMFGGILGVIMIHPAEPPWALCIAFCWPGELRGI